MTEGNIMTYKGPTLTLNNGVEMPAFGLGVFQSTRDETPAAVRAGIESGYGLIDTASGYQNEAEVGRGVRESAAERSEIFVTTKLRPTDYGTDAAQRAFDASMEKLGFDVLDLYLLHWPVPLDFDNTVASWQVCERLLAEGRVRAIGVCNFTPAHLRMLAERSEVVPAVNQIELHPFFVQQDHHDAHREMGIVTQAWSPIGGIQRYWGDGDTAKDPLHNSVIVALSEKYGKTPAQIVLRWQIDLGHSAIPKSVKPHRITENIDVFDFSLRPDEILAISALNTGKRGGPDPETQGTPTK
jgi:diketogulonate reductase-like aldo/keto reductase